MPDGRCEKCVNPTEEARTGSDGRSLPELLLGSEKPPATAGLYGRGVLLTFLTIWSCRFILEPMEEGYAIRSFMHLVNLPFHEGGHVIFSILGSRLLTSLGGSLMQLIIPLACAAVLLLKTRDPFGAAFSVWWLGESFIDLAPYIADARSLSLQLIGGNTGAEAPYGFHDWNFILSELDILSSDGKIAAAAHFAGAALMLAAIAWGAAFILWNTTRRERRA